MDIYVTQADGLPEKAYLSIRVGDTRRQAPFQPGEPFRFPTWNDKGFSVDVFEKVGSSQVILDRGQGTVPKQERQESVEIAREDGTGVKLSLKLCRSDTGKKSVPSGKTGDTARRHQTHIDAKNYLDGYSVQALLQNMVHGLLDKQPEDPITFMCSYLEKARHNPPVSQSVSPQKRSDKLQQASGYRPSPRTVASEPKLVSNFKPFPVNSCPEVLPDLSKHQSVMAQVLKSDPGLWGKLKHLKTQKGSTFAHCIKTGLENMGHPSIQIVGAVAGDEECYELFREFFEPLMALRHPSISLVSRHPIDMHSNKVTNTQIDPSGKYVVAACVSARRNLRGLSLAPCISQSDRREAERAISKVLCELSGDLHGEYYPLAASKSHLPKVGGMSTRDETMLREANLLFEAPDSNLALSAGIDRDWPDARGIFATAGRSLAVYINEEDHVRIVSIDSAGDLKGAFSKLAKLHLSMVEGMQGEGLEFMHQSRLGWVTVCPSNLGTGILASLQIRLPLMSLEPEFHEICKALGLRATDIGVQGDPFKAFVWELSLIDRFGISEVDLANVLIESCRTMVDMEIDLENGKQIPRAVELANGNAEVVRSSEQPQPPVIGREPPVVAAQPSPDSKQLKKQFTMPGLGDADYPGFPTDTCPAKPPNLANHHNVMAEILSMDPSVYERYKTSSTSTGLTFARCIKPGMDCRGNIAVTAPGAVMGDEECYQAFRDLWDPLLDICHGSYPSHAKHQTDMDHTKLSDAHIDRTGRYITAVELRLGRSMSGLRLPPWITKSERREVERAMTSALLNLSGKLKGKYFPLQGSSSYELSPDGMSFQDEQKLSASGFLFAEPHSTAALTSGLGRHWPDARGVFLMDDQNCVVHINAEEHVQIIVKGVGGNIQSAFVHLCELHGDLLHSLSQNGIDFMRSDRLGYVVACPSNLGTALRVYVTLQIPLLAEHVDFRQVCSCLHLEAKEELPSGAAVAKGAYVVSNAHTLGNTEVQIVNSVLDGCRQLVELEQMLENDKPLFFMLPGLGEKDYPGFSTKKCPTNMPDLSKHHSIAANVLKNDCALYDKLKDTSTSNGVSFATCIKSCVDNRGHAMIQNIGAVAGDEECYETFGEFFDPIIELWHGIPRKQGHPTDLDHTKVTDAQIDPTGKYVVANRLRSGRSIRGFPLPPSISKSERREAERLLTKALMNMSGELQGSYYPLVSSKSYMPMPNGMSKKDETALHDAGFLFHEPDSLTVLSSGMGRHWPDARGVFKTKCEKIVAWINEEDHVRFVSIDKGGDLKSTFARFCEVEKYLQQSLRVDGHDFMHNNELGYIVADPTNLGTGLRMSVTLRIPLLSMHPAFKEVCKRLRVEARAGLMSDPDECPGACDISNSQRFGKSEVELVNNLIEGCRRIIAFEMGLAGLEDGEALPLEA